MSLEINGFESSRVNSDGSQTLEPSNRLNRLEKTVQQTVPGSLAKTTDATPALPSHYDWLPPRLWSCPQCSATILTREAGPRCPICGFREGT
jgi:rubrerythrin